jgi:hypothetical protein
MIYNYTKYITREVSRWMNLPDGCTELATIDGVTYVYVPEGVELPEQPSEITVTPVTLTDELREAIKMASPHCQLINQRVIEQIRDRYTVDDEAYFSRIGIGVALGIYEFEPGENELLLEFGNYVEQCRQWGREQRANIGLGT